MAMKVFQAGITRESGYLYFLDKKGFICKVKMARGHSGRAKANPAKVMKTDIVRKPGFLYFVDKNGDVSMVKMSRSGRKKQPTKRRLAKNHTGAKAQEI